MEKINDYVFRLPYIKYKQRLVSAVKYSSIVTSTSQDMNSK